MTIEGVTTTTTSTTEAPLAAAAAAAQQPIQFNFNSGETALDSLELIERHFEPAFDQLGSSRLQVSTTFRCY